MFDSREEEEIYNEILAWEQNLGGHLMCEQDKIYKKEKYRIQEIFQDADSQLLEYNKHLLDCTDSEFSHSRLISKRTEDSPRQEHILVEKKNEDILIEDKKENILIEDKKEDIIIEYKKEDSINENNSIDKNKKENESEQNME